MERQIKIGERLSEMLAEKGINSNELAEAVGVNATTVRRWKKGTKLMRLHNAVLLADFFGCSLDFLTGRSDEYMDFMPKSRPEFYKHLKRLLEEKGVSRNKINTETRIKSSHLVDWKRGADPNIASLAELADYLDVTLDILVGRDM